MKDKMKDKNSILNNKRVLLVEDDHNLAHRLQNYLDSTHQTQTATAANLSEAYLYLKTQKPHLIILDRQLGLDDGIELLQHIRKSPALEDIAVVMLTGKGTEEDKDLAHQYHADGYLTKPFITKDLIRQIETLLRLSLIHI